MTGALMSIDTATGDMGVYVRSLRGGVKCNARIEFRPPGKWEEECGLITPAMIESFRRRNSQPDFIPLNPNSPTPTGGGASMAVAA